VLNSTAIAGADDIDDNTPVVDVALFLVDVEGKEPHADSEAPCIWELGAAYTDGIVEDEGAAGNQVSLYDGGEVGKEVLVVEEVKSGGGLIVDEEPLPKDWDAEFSTPRGGTLLVGLRTSKDEEV